MLSGGQTGQYLIISTYYTRQPDISHPHWQAQLHINMDKKRLDSSMEYDCKKYVV